MVQGYTEAVRKILRENGCKRLRSGKGDHEIWSCPRAKRPIVVDAKIMARHTANLVLKQAGISVKI